MCVHHTLYTVYSTLLVQDGYDVYEKALFGALSGNVEKVCATHSPVCGLVPFSPAQVLPACQTWYDYVWAYFKTLVDVQVETVSLYI